MGDAGPIRELACGSKPPWMLIAGLALALAPQALAGMPHRDQHQIHHQIQTLESQWKKAMVTNNVSDMEHLLADDYIAITANGTMETKAQALAVRRSAALHITQLEVSDTKIRIYGDTAVVTSRAEVTGTNGERDVSGHYRYTRVYNLRNGQWKIVSFEASRIRDPNDHVAEK